MSENECSHEVIVIGAGVAGLAAATEAARRGLQTALFDDGMLGGLITNVGELEGPPDHKGEAGADMVTAMLGEALEVAVDYQMGSVTELTATGDHWRVSGEDTLTAPRVILATGAQLRHLDVPGEAALMGRGVSQCAFCDGGLYRDKDVVVVGGGDTAMEDAIFLSRLVEHVTVVHRRDAFRASQIMGKRVLANEKIEVMWDSVVDEVLGEDGVEGVKLRNVKSDAITEVPATGLFVAIGHNPNTGVFGDQLTTDDQSFLVTTNTRTNIPGVFAAGDVQDPLYKQAVTAAGSGCMAALEVERYLAAVEG
ncbi:MAG: FAD-dependent oxidoreductase [Verrucomicrobia bacterium]|nr:FAD-dependent oxidoreductase [Verrucomicrobiota bacterium]